MATPHEDPLAIQNDNLEAALAAADEVMAAENWRNGSNTHSGQSQQPSPAERAKDRAKCIQQNGVGSQPVYTPQGQKLGCTKGR